MRLTYHYKEPKTPEEEKDQERRMTEIYKMFFEAALEEKKLKEKLKDLPSGFSIMDGDSYNCCICDMYVKDEELWYDKWGKKCLACQDAVDKNVIPASICKNQKARYTDFELDIYLKLKARTIKRLISQNVLKVRIIPKSGFRVFLLEENIDVLPPKAILKSIYIPVEGDKNSVIIDPWYEVKDPKKILGKYKIWPHLTALKNKQ